MKIGSQDEAVVKAAAALQQARASRRTIPQVSATFGLQGLEVAYAVAEISTLIRQETGVRVVGKKVGLTSEAVQRQLGVDQPDFGVLFDDMDVPRRPRGRRRRGCCSPRWRPRSPSCWAGSADW